MNSVIEKGRLKCCPYVLGVIVMLAACRSEVGTATPTPINGTPVDFSIPSTIDGTLTETATATQGATATAEATATQDYRTRPVTGIVTAASPLVPVEATLGALHGVPSNVQAWDRYVLRYIELSIPVPPGWIIREWPLPEDYPIYYSVSVIPDIYIGSQATVFPEITLTVYRAPLGESLNAWFLEHSSIEVFDRNAAADPNVFFYEVSRARAVRVGDVPALLFSRDVLDTRASTVLVANGETVATITAVTFSLTDLQRVYEVMLTGVEFLD